MMITVTTEQFTVALNSLGKPRGRQIDFLKAHACAEGRATTFSILAGHVNYRSYRAINLHYGKLARRIGDAMGHPNARITLLMAAAKPSSITNKNWVLVMHPEFAEALVKAAWI
jgi:hypothetical protein